VVECSRRHRVYGLSRLLDDLLDLSRLQSDQPLVELAPCQLKQIVDTSIDLVKAVATAKGIVLHYDVAAQIVVLCDDKLLK
jgi:signal transduction histidine kinase